MSFDAAEEGEEECWLVGRGLCSLDSIEPPPSPTASLLFFHGNALTDCHFAAQCGRAEPAFPHATLLDVSSNALTELDASVVAADCPALQSLDASANRISCVTGAVGALAHLRVLKLPFNQVASLAWLAGGHPLLEELDVRDNAVHHVHELPHLAALRALRHLWLQDATLDSASRVHSARANPVCAHAHYVATVLASCPALETLDGMRVAAWRQLLPQMAAAAEAPPPAPAPPAAPTHVSTAPMPVDVGVRAVGGSGAAPQMVLPTVMSTTFIPSPELAPPIPAGASLIPALSTPAIDRAANRFAARFASAVLPRTPPRNEGTQTEAPASPPVNASIAGAHSTRSASPPSQAKATSSDARRMMLMEEAVAALLSRALAQTATPPRTSAASEGSAFSTTRNQGMTDGTAPPHSGTLNAVCSVDAGTDGASARHDVASPSRGSDGAPAVTTPSPTRTSTDSPPHGAPQGLSVLESSAQSRVRGGGGALRAQEEPAAEGRAYSEDAGISSARASNSGRRTTQDAAHGEDAHASLNIAGVGLRARAPTAEETEANLPGPSTTAARLARMPRAHATFHGADGDEHAPPAALHARAPAHGLDAQTRPLAATAASLRVENNNLRKQAAAMKAELEAANTALAAAGDEQQRLRAELSAARVTHEAANASWTAAVADAQAASAAAASEATRLKAELASSAPLAELLALKRSVAEQEARAAECVPRSELTAVQVECRTLQQQLEQASADARTLMERLERVVTQLADEQRAHAATQERAAGLQSALAQALADVERATAAARSETEARERVESSTNMTQAQLASQLSAAIGRAHDAEASVASVTTALDAAKQATATAHAALDAAREEVAYWRQRCTDVVETARRDVETEREAAQKALAAMESRVTGARTAAEAEVRRVIAEARDRLAASRAAAVSLSEQVERWRTQAETSSRFLEQARLEAADARQEAAAWKAAAERAAAEVSSAQSARDGVAAEALSNLQREHAALRERLDAALVARAGAEERAQEAQHACDAAQEEVHKCKSALRVKEAMLEDQNESLRTLKRQLTASLEAAASAEAAQREAARQASSQLREALDAADAAERARDDALEEAHRASAAASAAQRVVAQLEASLRDARTQVDEADAMRRELAAKEAALNFVESEMSQIQAAYEAKVAAAHAERESAQREAAAAAAAVVDARRAQAAAEAEAARTLAEKARGDEMLAASEQRAQVLTARVASTEHEMRVLLRTLDETKARAREQAERMSALFHQFQREAAQHV